MKKIVIVFIAAFYINSQTFAQDIIVVRGNNEIRAKVVSISSKSIEYRLYDIEDSPLYLIKLQDVVSLTYEYGKTEDLSVFLPKATEKQIVKAKITEELKFFKEDNTFYLGNKRLSNNEIEKVLLSNSSALNAWIRGNNFKTANAAMKVSTGILIPVGSVLMFIGYIEAVAIATTYICAAPLYLLSGTSPSSDEYRSGWFPAGIILFSAGVITGIMIPVTKANYKSCYSDAAQIYNKSKNTVSLHIGTTGNGLGFSLKF